MLWSSGSALLAAVVCESVAGGGVVVAAVVVVVAAAVEGMCVDIGFNAPEADFSFDGIAARQWTLMMDPSITRCLEQ